ncbi:MAG: hypothetical protein K6E91_02395 [Butyrivibrio sp.]|nr:hypothetical protein [Butyrivibrio sp.]
MGAKDFRRRLIIILYILSTAASIIIFSIVMNSVAIDIECKSYRQYAVEGSRIYYSDNLREGGFIFSMDSKGIVSHMFSAKETGDDRILGLSVNEGKVYAVLSTFIEQKDEKDENALDSEPCYRIICLDNKLKLQTQTQKFTINEDEMFSGFSAEPTGLFLTMISKDGAYVKVYGVDQHFLKENLENTDRNVTIENVRTKRADETRYYCEALYSKGELHLRTDKDAPEGVFETDEFIRKVVSGMKLRLGHLFSLYAQYIIWYFAILIIWFIVLYLIIRGVSDRNRSVYYIIIAEFVLFVIAAAASYAVAVNYEDARSVEHSRFAVISMLGLSEGAGLKERCDYSDPEFYDTEQYQRIRKNLTEFIRRDGNSDIFYDVLVLRLRDSIVCASGSGRNQEAIEELYGIKLLPIADMIHRGQKYAAIDFTIEGQKYRAVAVTDSLTAPEYALVGIINSTTMSSSVFVDNIGVLIVFIITFAVGSAFVVLAWFLHMRDLIALEQALSDVAMGSEMPDRPVILGRDVKDMWDSAQELAMKMEEIQYSKLRILEAYYRFAPKNVEKVLGKNSILEVKSGDHKLVRGTVGMAGIEFPDERKHDTLANLIGSIGLYQKNHDSIMIGKSPDMSRMQILFMDSEKEVTNAFIELSMASATAAGGVKSSTVLFHDECEFGVLGNEIESTTYLKAAHQDLLYSCTSIVQELDLGLVISERIKEREHIETGLRFVGYAALNKDSERIKLYEVLDAYPARKRAERLSTLDKYMEALNLYYERDFYIARTKFSDILKETPGDSLVRWYVFEADRYLNEIVEDDSFMILHT